MAPDKRKRQPEDSEDPFLEQMNRELVGWRDPVARLRQALERDERSEVARHKLKAVVHVGETIGIEVIAECVEASDVLALLRELKVGYAQGFGIARPAPIALGAAGAA